MQKIIHDFKNIMLCYCDMHVHERFTYVLQHCTYRRDNLWEIAEQEHLDMAWRLV